MQTHSTQNRIRNTLLRIIVSTISISLCLYLVLSWYFSGLILYAAPDELDDFKITKQKTFDDSVPAVLEFKSDDGMAFTAWHFKRSEPSKCLIIFSHGWQNSRVGIDKFHQAFSFSHCDQLSYDLRGHGHHQAQQSTGGIQEKHDLVQLSQQLANQLGLRESQVAWFGVSLGASISLQAANLGFRPAFIIADSPFQDWDTAIFERGVEMYGAWVNYFRPGVRAVIQLRAGIDYVDASVLNNAANIDSPVLLIHSLTDASTAPTQSQNIYAELGSEHGELQLTDWGAKHAKDVEVRPNEYQAMLLDFMARRAPQFLAD